MGAGIPVGLRRQAGGLDSFVEKPFEIVVAGQFVDLATLLVTNQVPPGFGAKPPLAI
jgi:hypothetical protein